MQILTTEYSGHSGVYVSVEPDATSKAQLVDLFTSLKPPFSLDEFKEEAHMTIMYSKSNEIDIGQLGDHPDDLLALSGKLEYWGGHDDSGYLVLHMISKPASDLHDHLVGIGATHSFRDYDPHMTIAHRVPLETLSRWIETTNEHLMSNKFIIKFDRLVVTDCKQD